MTATADLLDKVKERCSIPSDNALSQKLGVTRAVVSTWRSGGTPLSDERIAQLCAMAKIDGATWMATIHAERATSVTERALWRLILDRVSAAAAVLVLVVFSAPGVARAKAIEINNLQQGDAAVCILCCGQERQRPMHQPLKPIPQDPAHSPHQSLQISPNHTP